MVRYGIIRKRARDVFAERCIKEMNVRCDGPGAMATSLSGGNIQKFIVGRELLSQPKVLIASQPTWGIDVGAAEVVRRRLIELRDRGVSILIFSEDLEELFEISDRMVVMFEGRYVGARDHTADYARKNRADDAGSLRRFRTGTVL